MGTLGGGGGGSGSLRFRNPGGGESGWSPGNSSASLAWTNFSIFSPDQNIIITDRLRQDEKNQRNDSINWCWKIINAVELKVDMT